MHRIDNYLHNPTHPVKICLAGCGGTGSQVLPGLGQIDVTLREMEHPGISVTVYDPEKIEIADVGRQNFSIHDIGDYKGRTLVTRVNRYFGSSWNFIPKEFTGKNSRYNIIITCTDTIESRKKVYKFLIEQLGKVESLVNQYNYERPIYWIDAGNDLETGQVIIQSISDQFISLPDIFSLFGDFIHKGDDDNTPSCSIMQSLGKQDLFINTMVAKTLTSILWYMFKNAYLDFHGVMINLSTFSMKPLKMKKNEKKHTKS